MNLKEQMFAMNLRAVGHQRHLEACGLAKVDVVAADSSRKCLVLGEQADGIYEDITGRVNASNNLDSFRQVSGSVNPRWSLVNARSGKSGR